MSCSTCQACGIKEEYYSLAIDNPLYYTQTIGGITRFYEFISLFSEYCENPSCERLGNWQNYTSKEAASVSIALDDQGNYILTVAVNISAQGMHGYTTIPDFGSNYSCSDSLSLTQSATISNNGTGPTNAKLNSLNQNCCACSYSAIYSADNPFEQIPWIQNSDGCGPGFIVCSPNQSYVTLGPIRNTLCLPPNCPNSSSFGVYPPVTINMSKEITAKDFLAQQQKVIDIKKTFSINWSTGLSDPGRTIPNPIEGGRFIRFKPSLSTGSLDKKNLKIEIKNEDCELLETFTRSINASSGPGAEIQVNLAKYAITSDENASWGPNQIGKRIVFQVSETPN